MKLDEDQLLPSLSSIGRDVEACVVDLSAKVGQATARSPDFPTRKDVLTPKFRLAFGFENQPPQHPPASQSRPKR